MKFHFEDGDLKNLGELLANPQKIALEVAQAALEIAVSNSPEKTGRLKRSGKVLKTARGAELIFDAALSGKTPYPSFVHDGTRNRDGSTRMAERPFIQQAVDQAVKQQTDVIVTRLFYDE